MEHKNRLKFVFGFVLLVILVNSVFASDYCFLKMKDGDSIATPSGGTYDCTHTICQICYDQSNEQSANWNDCNGAPVCEDIESEEDSVTGGLKVTLNSPSEDRDNSEIEDKNYEVSSNTNPTNNSRKNIFSGVLITGTEVNKNKNNLSLPMVFALISPFILFIILIFLLIIDKNMKKAKTKIDKKEKKIRKYSS